MHFHLRNQYGNLRTFADGRSYCAMPESRGQELNAFITHFVYLFPAFLKYLPLLTDQVYLCNLHDRFNNISPRRMCIGEIFMR